MNSGKAEMEGSESRDEVKRKEQAGTEGGERERERERERENDGWKEERDGTKQKEWKEKDEERETKAGSDSQFN